VRQQPLPMEIRVAVGTEAGRHNPVYFLFFCTRCLLTLNYTEV
jgi:hypothetical protein